MYLVMTKRSFNLTFRVAPELDAAFDLNAKKIGQTKSNLLGMLMEAFNQAIDKDGQVVMPIQIKRPSDCATPSSASVYPIINGHGNHVRTHVRDKSK